METPKTKIQITCSSAPQLHKPLPSFLGCTNRFLSSYLQLTSAADEDLCLYLWNSQCVQRSVVWLKNKNIIHCISINSFPEALWQPMRRLQLWKWDMIPRIIKEFRSLKILWILCLTSFPWQRIHKVQEKFENINKFAESRNIRKGREKWWKSARVHIWRENRNKGI